MPASWRACIHACGPTTGLDRWLGLTIQGAIVAPLLVDDLPFGVMLVVNRQDESGLFVPRAKSGLTPALSAEAVGDCLGRAAGTKPSGPAADGCPYAGAPRCAGARNCSRAAVARPTQATPAPEARAGLAAPERTRKKPDGTWDTLVTLAFCRLRP